VLVGLLASLLAELEVLPRDKVFWLVLFAWSGLGASFGPAVIISLYWRRMTTWGAFAGIVTGAVVTVLWKSIPAIKNLISDYIPALKGLTYELVPAFILACIAIWIVSLLTQPDVETTSDWHELMRGKAD
jgi:SSS family solute:Na+ symporter